MSWPGCIPRTTPLQEISWHPFDGKVRGLLSSGQSVKKGFKVGDVDPRGEEVDETLISDKARAVAGGVLEAILLLRSRAAAQ
jgi:xanthine dehydrogenase accessory factor